MTKKILIVADFYKPHLSGITTYIDLVIEYLIRKNFKITILTIKHDKSLKSLEKNDKITIIRSKPTFSIGRGFYSLGLIKNYIIQFKKHDYIDVHYPLAEIFPLFFLFNNKTIFHYHCIPFYKKFYLKFIQTYFYFFGLISMYFAKKTVTLSEDYLLNFLFHNKFLNKIIEIPPYIPFIPPINTNKAIKNIDNVKIGYLGRISEEKGLEIIGKTSDLLFKKNIQHEFIIAGDNKDKRFKKYINKIYLLAKNNKRIKFIGSIAEQDKSNFFNSIDMLILPSTNSYEAFGIVQIEAMLHGIPVIASNLNGVRMPIKCTGNGYIFETGNAFMLIENILKIMNNKTLTKLKIQRNCLDNFNEDKFDKQSLLLFDL